MRARRVDENHAAIVRVLREACISVFDASAFSKGFPDLVCSYGGRSLLVEIKDGAKSPSQRKLTPAQVKFHAEWQDKIEIIETVEQAKLWAGAMKILIDGGLK